MRLPVPKFKIPPAIATTIATAIAAENFCWEFETPLNLRKNTNVFWARVKLRRDIIITFCFLAFMPQHKHLEIISFADPTHLLRSNANPKHTLGHKADPKYLLWSFAGPKCIFRSLVDPEYSEILYQDICYNSVSL